MPISPKPVMSSSADQGLKKRFQRQSTVDFPAFEAGKRNLHISRNNAISPRAEGREYVQ